MTHQTLLEVFGSAYDQSYEIIYYNYWVSYEEDAHLCILFRDGIYYSLSWGYCVMCDENTPQWILIAYTSQDDAIANMIEWDEMVIVNNNNM